MSDDTTPIVWKPEFEPTLLCEAGHRVVLAEWRSAIDLSNLSDPMRCDAPVWAATRKSAVCLPERLPMYEAEGDVVRCGKEYEDIQFYVGDIGRLLALYEDGSDNASSGDDQ